MGNSDAHLSGQIGTPHTVVQAEELSTDAVLAGIRAGRSRARVASLPGTGAGEVKWRVDTADPTFVRVEVRHPGGDMAALSNPIILG